jgi:hypothetical protein
MTGTQILLRRQKESFIPIEGNGSLLSSYLRRTDRAVHALFDQKGLKDHGNGHYSYLARPITMVRWEVHPILSFHTEHPTALHQDPVDFRLVLDSCELVGNERWSVVNQNLTFHCGASIGASRDGVWARAYAATTIRPSGWLQMIPAVVIHELATPVVDWVLARLLTRCERSLRKDMENWLHKQPAVVTS